MISVVVPVHNAAQTLDECLQAIYRSNYPDYEVLVVDDASTDDTLLVARQYPCRVISLPENVGAARAKNVGAKEAKGDIILFTDADVFPLIRWLVRGAALFSLTVMVKCSIVTWVFRISQF